MHLDKKILDQLVELMRRDGLDRVRVRVDGMDLDVRMSRDNLGSVLATPAAGSTAQIPAAAPKTDEAPPNVRKVLAPLVGVFYRAPAPGAPPFVEIGNAVAPGQVLCILEAMKLMNEIVSEFEGKVVKVLAKDGELVQLHQSLFWIET